MAATVYAVGKTFMWPTLLAVASERFPKGGALRSGHGRGGHALRRAAGRPRHRVQPGRPHATAKLNAENPAVYERYKADAPDSFLFFHTTGLDGAKVGVLENNGQDINIDPNLAGLKSWWATAKNTAAQDAPLVSDAELHGDKAALKITATVPAIQAFILLCILFYFKSKGGYKQVHIEGQGQAAHEAP